jgi:hypothetical protein
MKYKRRNISFTKKRKAKSVIGEWTKASHKRLLVNEIDKKEDQSTWGSGSGIDQQSQDGWGAGGR